VSETFDSALRLARRERIERMLDVQELMPPAPDSALKDLYKRCAEELPQTIDNLAHEKVVGAQREANAVFDRIYKPREQANSVRVPWQSLLYATTRADVVGTTTAGGYLVDTLNLSAAQSLLSLMVVGKLGITPIDPGAHNVAWPKVTASASTAWLSAETSQLSEAEQTFGQTSFSPHTVGGYTEISRLLLTQSNAVSVVGNDLSRKVGRAVQAAVLNGSGSAGAPHGVIGTTGVSTTSGSTFALATAATAIGDVGDALEDGSAPGWVFDKASALLLRQRAELTNSTKTLWQGPITFGNGPGDFPAAATSGMPSATGIFGCWKYSGLAVWGALELAVNPFANFTAGIIGVRCLVTCDFGLLWPGAFTTVTSVS